MNLVTLIIGALLAVSLATNIIVYLAWRAIANHARNSPEDCLESLFRPIPAYRDMVIFVDIDGKVQIECMACVRNGVVDAKYEDDSLS